MKEHIKRIRLHQVFSYRPSHRRSGQVSNGAENLFASWFGGGIVLCLKAMLFLSSISLSSTRREFLRGLAQRRSVPLISSIVLAFRLASMPPLGRADLLFSGAGIRVRHRGDPNANYMFLVSRG